MRLPEFGAVEDLIQGVLLRYFRGTIPVKTMYDGTGPTPMIVSRAQRRAGVFTGMGQSKYNRRRVLEIEAFTSGLEADADGAYLLEACEHALILARDEQWVVPGVGYLQAFQIMSPATRVADWATATSVVQYASLPKGWVRHEMIVRVRYGPDVGRASGNPFIMRD